MHKSLSIAQDMPAILAGQEDGEISLLAALEEIQRRYRYLPRDVLILLGERLDIPLSQVYAVATFYNAFSLRPQGRHRLQVCTGTACHVRGAVQVLDRLETRLGIRAGETSADQECTLETVNCLGACALGPVVVTDGDYVRHMTAGKVDRLLKQVRRQRMEADESG
jgi:NADH-quinone oxidoreductase subunit E